MCRTAPGRRRRTDSSSRVLVRRVSAVRSYGTPGAAVRAGSPPLSRVVLLWRSPALIVLSRAASGRERDHAWAFAPRPALPAAPCSVCPEVGARFDVAQSLVGGGRMPTPLRRRHPHFVSRMSRRWLLRADRFAPACEFAMHRRHFGNGRLRCFSATGLRRRRRLGTGPPRGSRSAM